MILWQYQCRLCGRHTEERRDLKRRNRASYCETCDVWSGRRVVTAPALRGQTVART